MGQPNAPWPSKPFYILSKQALDGISDWTLTVGQNNNFNIQRSTYTIDQLWQAVPSPSGGAFLLNIGSGLVLQGQDGGKPLLVRSLDTGNAWQRFNSEGTGWACINAINDGELKVNIFGPNVNGPVGLYHWDGGHDNEEWMLTQEQGQVTVDSIRYDMTKAAGDFGLPPSHCEAAVCDGPSTVTMALARSITKTQSFATSQSSTTGHKYTQTFGVKGGIDKVVEVSASFSFEESDSETNSLTNQDTSSDTVTDTVSVQVAVPAGKKYQCQIVVYYGKVTVPYTANLTFQSSIPGAKPVTVPTSGMFTGVNSTRSEVQIIDLTSPTKALVESRAL